MENNENTDLLTMEENMDALHASELRYRRLFETARDGILILDAVTGQIVDVNPFLIELLGYSYPQFINKSVWDIGLFKDVISNRDKFMELKEKKYVRFEDLPLETSDGRKIDVEFVSNVYKQNHHDVIQCNIRDITDRKRASDAIAAEQELLAVTFHSIVDGVIATDVQGNVEIMNCVAEELTGWKQDEANGKPLFSVFNIIDETTRTPHDDLVEKVLKTGEIVELADHTVIISKTGIERVIADCAAPIRDRNNRIIGIVLVFQDITEKTKLLETMQRNQKLESLGLLAGGIAHDFNNLMGGIFGYVDLAIEESTENRVKQYLTKAMQTIDRTRGLTRQLLTFAKGGAPVQKVMSLLPLIRETSQFALSGSNVSCQYNLPNDLWPCLIDKEQICQVIDNIVINAQQAMPSGGAIEITAKNSSMGDREHVTLKKGNYVKMSIKDHGIGMSSTFFSKIFDPFFTTKQKGHGLGLATCHSIVTRHCGAIDVESILGEGSTFHIFLPASTTIVLCTGVQAGIKHTGIGTILVVDDEEIIRDIIGDMLVSFGYTVVCKENGEDALGFLSSEIKAHRKIIAIIFDLTIPGRMGGKDAIGAIRKLCSDVPVFVASGYAEDPVMANPKEYGFSASICKPFSKDDLAKILNEHLKPSK
jgi:PAS domain S-box-containing protein